MFRLLTLLSLFLVFLTPRMAEATQSLPEICRLITAHADLPAVGDHEVSADYQPGKDIHGNDVVGPDLEGSIKNDSEHTEFNIKIDVLEYLGIVMPGVVVETDMVKIIQKDEDLYIKVPQETPKGNGQEQEVKRDIGEILLNKEMVKSLSKLCTERTKGPQAKKGKDQNKEGSHSPTENSPLDKGQKNKTHQKTQNSQ